MLRPMQSTRRQPTTPQPHPRRKATAPAVVHRRAVTAARQRAFVLPDVREIPRRTAAGPWEAGW
jgi:hypothetical protein